MNTKNWFMILVMLVIVVSCTTDEIEPIIVRLQVDGRELVYQHTEPITVEQFLREANIELNPLDRINPPEPWRQITNNMLITIVRVVEEEQCEDVSIPFRSETRLFEGLQPGEERVERAGSPGLERVCYRVVIENGVPRERIEASRVIIESPVNEVIFVGPTTELEPVPISGVLAYISNGNAWIIRGNSTRKRPLTITSDLDRRVFELSPDGRQLLFSRVREGGINQLWLIPDTAANDPQMVSLIPQDVLYADWVPNTPNTISYSTAESQQSPPGWNAFNDLWIITIDPATGRQIRIEEILPESSGGIYGWWGTNYEWSPDGTQLAWIRANAVGLVDLENGELEEPLVEYVELQTGQDWSWRTTVSWWGLDSSLIATTTHGLPVGDEPAETSPVFNITVASADGSFVADIVPQAGIWSTPRFSPPIIDPDSAYPSGYIAYLRAREWERSINGEYDLIVADRDGSNARVIFPEPDQPGLTARQFANHFTWSPDGSQLALIYLGDLWVIDVETGIASQITQDGGASNPVWVP